MDLFARRQAPVAEIGEQSGLLVLEVVVFDHAVGALVEEYPAAVGDFGAKPNIEEYCVGRDLIRR